jgi:hypothetical protein
MFPMTELEQFIAESHLETLSMAGIAYEFMGRELIAIDGERSHGREVDVAGFGSDKSVTITVALAELHGITGGVLNVQGKRVKCKSTGTVFRIANVVENTLTLIDLELIAETQAA